MKTFLNNYFTAVIFATLCLFTDTCEAQDAKAKSLLQEVSAKVKGYGNMVIDFKYAIESAKTQESSGNVTMQGDKYVLNLLGVTKIFDGQKTYTINADDQEISIANYSESSTNSITPSRMLTFFNTGYKPAMDVVKNVGGRKIQFVRLVPINAKSTQKEVLIGIDLLTKNIFSLVDISKNGSKTRITINSFKTNQPLSKNQFTFVESKYPKYYINKLD